MMSFDQNNSHEGKNLNERMGNFSDKVGVTAGRPISCTFAKIKFSARHLTKAKIVTNNLRD